MKDGRALYMGYCLSFTSMCLAYGMNQSRRDKLIFCISSAKTIQMIKMFHLLMHAENMKNRRLHIFAQFKCKIGPLDCPGPQWLC